MQGTDETKDCAQLMLSLEHSHFLLGLFMFLWFQTYILYLYRANTVCKCNHFNCWTVNHTLIINHPLFQTISLMFDSCFNWNYRSNILQFNQFLHYDKVNTCTNVLYFKNIFCLLCFRYLHFVVFLQSISNRRHVLAKLDWWMTGNEMKKGMMKMKMKDETVCRLSITECGQPQNRSFKWTTSQVKHQMVHPLTKANSLLSLTANFLNVSL